MPKNLVLFSDGTGNGASALFKTNVWRLYQALDLKDPADPAQPRQFTRYDDGVGTSSFKPLAWLGGAFGVGLARNVQDLYVFLCRSYAPGDRIYVFGFSRGAFTIRVLIGLVMSQGLLRWQGSEAELQRQARNAYRAFRAAKFGGNPMVALLRALRDGWLWLWNGLLRRPAFSPELCIGRPGSSDAIEIHFAGLWDTVDAYGLPVDELTRAIDIFIWPLTMRDYTLDKRVLRACHALALDDERNAFHPRLWNDADDSIDLADPRGRDGQPVAPNIGHERISQVWFAGMHANVGGGYPDDGLACVALGWVMDQAELNGLRLEPQIRDELKALADDNAPLYDSRHGLAGYYRYNPRRIEALVQRDRLRIGPVKVHESVLRRIQAGTDGYAPITLPPGFAVVTIAGDIVDGDTYLRGRTPGGGAAGGAPVPAAAALAPASTAWVGRDSSYGALREHVYNGVWWRRLAYFGTLGLTAALALMPLLQPGNGACSGWLCFLAAPIAALGKLLPGFAAPWTDAMASHPNRLLPLALAVALGLWLGGWLDQRLRDKMRRLWYAIPALQPAAVNLLPPPGPIGPLGRWIEWLRTRPAYQGAFHLLTHGLLPAGFLLTGVYAAVALTGQLGFAAKASWGQVCPDEGRSQAGGLGVAVAWDVKRLCVATGVIAKAGNTYQLHLRVPASSRWWDADLPAGPGGLECASPTPTALLLAAGIPLRRHLAQGWFQPMAPIGDKGNDSYALAGDPQTALPDSRCPVRSLAPPLPGTPGADCPSQPPAAAPGDSLLQARLVARTDGPLFVYVNDGIPLPGLGQRLYANNTGCGWVWVTEVEPPAVP